jgi:hypothetical protein
MEACCLDIPGWSTTILDIIERSNDNTSRPREVTVPSSGPPLAIRLARGSIAMIKNIGSKAFARASLNVAPC